MFGTAQRWLAGDAVDAVLVGGADSLCQLTLRGFKSLGLLSESPTRPFSAEREGINIGEGAAFLLIEREGEGRGMSSAAESPKASSGDLHVVLVHPEIHGNTGSSGRTCLAAGARLHLVEPLGFSLDDARVKRAGLDYWPRVRPRVWASWEDIEASLADLGEPIKHGD